MPRLDIPEDPDAIHAVLIDRINQHTVLLEKHEQMLQGVVDCNKEQTAQLLQIQGDTAKIIELFRVGEGAVTTARWIIKLIMQVGAIVVALAGLGYFQWFTGDK